MKSRLPTTDHAKRLAAIMHRRLSTPWMPKEIKAKRAIGLIEETDILSLERYYRKNWPPGKNQNILRRDLFTLLNNFRSEVDRANIWNESRPDKPIPRKIIPLPPAPSEPFIQTEEARARTDAFMEEYRARKKRQA